MLPHLAFKTLAKSTLLLSVGIGVGITAGMGWTSWSTDKAAAKQQPNSSRTSAASSNIRPPTPSLSPAEVVTLQVRSMRAALDSPGEMLQCYEFASPGNRAALGPLERFSELVMTDPYTALSQAKYWQVGEASLSGDVASVLVTTSAGFGEANGFRFLLSKQTEPPYTDCWMTDAVVSLTLVDLDGLPISPPERGPVRP